MRIDLGEDGVATVVDRGVVERVHQQLFAHLADGRADLAPDAGRLGEGQHRVDGAAAALVVAQPGQVHLDVRAAGTSRCRKYRR